MAYVPLIAPSTTTHRIRFLSSIADSFIYVVSKVRRLGMEVGDISDLNQMGTTGSSDKVALNSALPDIIARVKEYATVPLAVGFGVSTREHFNTVAGAGAEGVVIGSRLVSVIKQAPPTRVAAKVEEYCRSISLKGQPPQDTQTKDRRQATKPVLKVDHAKPLAPSSTSETTALPPRFGQFGGQYVPEALFDCLIELEHAHKSAMTDPEFWKEWEGLFKYMNRPSNLYFAEKLTEHAGGARIWMKREDLFVHVHHPDYLSLGLRAALAITQARIRSIML
jgi:tryptophan synthase